MRKEEKQLFKSLCNFKAENFDESLIEYVTPHVLGHLFFNRMQAVAYTCIDVIELITIQKFKQLHLQMGSY